MKKTASLACALLCFASLAIAETPRLPPGAPLAADAITAAALRSHIRFLSDDLLEGRGPATRGDELARLYLASQMESLGLQPGGPGGSWFQPVPVISLHAHPPQTWSFAAGSQSVDLTLSDDFIAASGQQAARARLTDAELVFVGFGIQAPEYGWDDFKGMDLRGKVLVMLNNDPAGDPKLFAGERRLYYGRWSYKYESAARQGAAGAIIVHTTPSAGYPWQVVQTSWTGPQFELLAGSEPRIQLKAWTTEAATRRLFAAAGKDLDALVAAAQKIDFRPVPLGIRTSLDVDVTMSRTETANVLGLLPGSDPKLKDEVVIFTAHHDHLGRNDEQKGDDHIYNGAVDNAAGCAQVLAMAKAFTALPQPPRRSILFLFVAAEEQGLLGSKYFATNPTIAPGRMAANLNFDGGNIFGRTRDISLVSKGKSSLDSIVEAFAAQQGRRVEGDAFPDKGFFYRSDQFNLAKIGVPAIYTHNGTDFVGKPDGWGKTTLEAWTQRDYHQPSDELTESWNFEGMVEDARLGFLAGLAISEADAMPTWNPGDEFEAARRRALTEIGK